jgi:hypothetical protein
MDYIYKFLAYALTDLENHRTDTIYQDSLVRHQSSELKSN